jgi:ribulose-phosphate 3-epimerase
MSRVVRICPSILNADRAHLNSEIDKVSSADLLHLDIMDNVFVPNQTFDFHQTREIIGHSQIPVDTHLMIHNPDELAVDYAAAGSASVTFHFEASKSPIDTLSAIRDLGVRAGLAIKPKTTIDEVSDLLKYVDMFLVMTVEPGFGGQSFMADQLSKIQEAHFAIQALHGKKPWLQVDGGITLETILLAAEAGADTFVAGSAIYKAKSPKKMITSLRHAATL